MLYEKQTFCKQNINFSSKFPNEKSLAAFKKTLSGKKMPVGTRLGSADLGSLFKNKVRL